MFPSLALLTLTSKFKPSHTLSPPPSPPKIFKKYHSKKNENLHDDKNSNEEIENSKPRHEFVEK